MADKYVSVDTLGEREVERLETVRVVDKDTGMGHLEDKMVSRTEAQGILDDAEAMVLKDAEWRESSLAHKQYGKFTCIVAGRRFFAGINPAEHVDPPATLEELTNAELVEIAKDAVIEKFPTQSEEAKAYFKEYDFGDMNLKTKNKATLISIINHFKGDDGKAE